MTNQATNQSQPQYFDFVAKGLAYINRFRSVDGNGGEDYFACTLNVLYGNSNKVKYSNVDCIIVGEEAQALLSEYEQAILSKEVKVFGCVHIGDMHSVPFQFKQGQKEGQWGSTIKARLLKVTDLRIDGELIESTKSAVADDSVVDSDQHQIDTTTTIPSVKFGDPNWPLEKIVEVSKDDPKYLTKLARLQDCGYTGTCTATGLICEAKSDLASKKLAERNADFLMSTSQS